MSVHIGRVGIKLHFLFFIALSYMLSLNMGKIYLTALFYASLHESAHIIALTKLYDGRFTVTLGAFGMRLNYDDCAVFTLKNEAVTAFSGPCVNMVLSLLFFFLTKYYSNSEFCYVSLIINVSLSFFNLLPVIPLDGGRFLYNVISMKFDAEAADSVLHVTGICSMILFAAFLFLMKSNLTGILAFLYIGVSFVSGLLKKNSD